LPFFFLDEKEPKKQGLPVVGRLRRTFLKIMRPAVKKTNPALQVILLQLSVTIGPFD